MGSKSLIRAVTIAVFLAFCVSVSHSEPVPKELKGAFRRPKSNGWTYVHLQGTPHQIGFQNGYLLAPEIRDLLEVVELEAQHDDKKEWAFFRDAAQKVFWPHIEQEYREELQGIADGASAHGLKIDVWDVIGINALGVAPTGATAAFYKSKGMNYPPEYGPLAAVTPGTPGGILVMLAEELNKG